MTSEGESDIDERYIVCTRITGVRRFSNDEVGPSGHDRKPFFPGVGCLDERCIVE